MRNMVVLIDTNVLLNYITSRPDQYLDQSVEIVRMCASEECEGYIYTSFKHGDYEGERNGRFFVDFTLELWEQFIADIDEFKMVEHWYTADARPGREEEKWFNVIMKKVRV